MKAVIFFVVFASAIYILYLNGFLTFKNIKSVYFVGKNGFIDKRCSAKFSACTGTIKRILKFKESKIYTFILDTSLESGEIKATIRESNGKDLLVLTPDNPIGTLKVSASAYCLVFEMYKAYGSYELTWK